MPSRDCPLCPSRRLSVTPRHNEGHHKLIKWGMTHGAIDGDARCVVWLRA